MVDYLPAALIVAAFALHLAGERRAAARTGRPRGRRARRRAFTFYAGLLTVLVALTGPLDALSGRLFWVQMIQRLLVLTVAAPLIALGRPWISLWRPFPPWARRPVTRAVALSPFWAPVRWLFRALARPPGAWLAFSINLLFWHLPGPFDLALRNSWVHFLEYSAFLLFGIFFWILVTGSSRAASRFSHARRIGYLGTAMVTNVGLSIFLAFSQHPLYAPYAELAHRLGGISALADQQIGAGVMWAAGDVPFAIVLALLVQQWLAAHEATMARLGRLPLDATPPATDPPLDAPPAAGPPLAQVAALPLKTTPATGGHAGRRDGFP
jgi:putative membrane protein